MFGESAEVARHGVSGRLLAWAEAFEVWLQEKESKHTRSAVKQAKYAWQKLLSNRQGSRLWELGDEDIQAHVEWMEAQGYAASTIENELASIRSFYRWCDERRVDPLCQPGFNPAAGVKRPAQRRFATARIWSQAELEQLLGFARRDASPLGKREYAFFQTRLQVGVATRAIRGLQWGQLVQDEKIQVRWRREGDWTRFPDGAWAAIREYLEFSGRLAGMQAGFFIFAPLAGQGSSGDNTRAADWAPGRCISAKTARKNLKIYGRALGIPERLLNLEALRNTAIRLQLDAGKSIAEMQVFLGSQAEGKQTKFKMKLLPPMPPDPDPGEGDIAEILLPNRKAVHFQPGHGLLHGYYLESQPAEGVLAVISEGITGVEEEMAGLRLLARGLVERQTTAERKYTPQLADAHSRAASRVSDMIQVEKQGQGENQWVDELLERFDQVMKELGEEPVSKQIRAEFEGSAALTITSRNLAEEIAGTRYMLRNVLAMAMETQPVPEYVHLVDIYGSGCVRLVRLLKREQGGLPGHGSNLLEVLREKMQEAIGWGV